VSNKDQIKLSYYLIDTKSSKTIIYFHGNGSDFIVDYPFIESIAQNLHYNVIYMDYRGYGSSRGYPTQKNILFDSIQFINLIMKERYFENTNFFIIGASLGGAIVLNMLDEIMLHKNKIKGIIIQNTFTSMIELISHKLPFCSVCLVKNLVTEKWDNINAIKNAG